MSARIAGVHWCEGTSKREKRHCLCSHLSQSSWGQKCAHDRKENYTCTCPAGGAKEGFGEREAPDREHPEAERWDGNSTSQRVWRPGFHSWLCHPHPVGRWASLPSHPNERVIPEGLKASCSALCCCDFSGGGVKKGALKEVSVGQPLEEGRVVDRHRRGKRHFRLRGWHRQVRKNSSC